MILLLVRQRYSRVRETGFYYLQSRYYDPALGRFLNADSYASTGQGFLGYNMFAYCNNNPVNSSDPIGCSPSSSDDFNDNGIPDYLERRWVEMTNRYRCGKEKRKIRDVTEEVDRALNDTVTWASFASSILHLTSKCVFYLDVRAGGAWDIKLKDPWRYSIGTEFPGSYDTVVLYHDHYYTPEILGNYTYGAIGNAVGFNLEILLFGSMFAAQFPEEGSPEYSDEMKDRLFVAEGFFR